MGWLSGIASGVKAIFGADDKGTDNVMKVASGIGGWIDGQQFTDQEKAEFSAKLIPAFQDYMNSTVGENTERSRTRRTIAIWVIRNWIFLLWVAIIARWLEWMLDKEAVMSSFILAIVQYPTLDYFVLGVGAFFFGAHIVRQVKG